MTVVGPGEQIGGGPQRKRAKVDTDLESRLRKESRDKATQKLMRGAQPVSKVPSQPSPNPNSTVVKLRLKPLASVQQEQQPPKPNQPSGQQKAMTQPRQAPLTPRSTTAATKGSLPSLSASKPTSKPTTNPTSKATLNPVQSQTKPAGLALKAKQTTKKTATKLPIKPTPKHTKPPVYNDGIDVSALEKISVCKNKSDSKLSAPPTNTHTKATTSTTSTNSRPSAATNTKATLTTDAQAQNIATRNATSTNTTATIKAQKPTTPRPTQPAAKPKPTKPATEEDQFLDEILSAGAIVDSSKTRRASPTTITKFPSATNATAPTTPTSLASYAAFVAQKRKSEEDSTGSTNASTSSKKAKTSAGASPGTAKATQKSPKTTTTTTPTANGIKKVTTIPLKKTPTPTPTRPATTGLNKPTSATNKPITSKPLTIPKPTAKPASRPRSQSESQPRGPSLLGYANDGFVVDDGNAYEAGHLSNFLKELGFYRGPTSVSSYYKDIAREDDQEEWDGEIYDDGDECMEVGFTEQRMEEQKSAMEGKKEDQIEKMREKKGDAAAEALRRKLYGPKKGAQKPVGRRPASLGGRPAQSSAAVKRLPTNTTSPQQTSNKPTNTTIVRRVVSNSAKREPQAKPIKGIDDLF